MCVTSACLHLALSALVVLNLLYSEVLFFYKKHYGYLCNYHVTTQLPNVSMSIVGQTDCLSVVLVLHPKVLRTQFLAFVIR